MSEELLQELSALPPSGHAPTMGALGKVRYSHQDMIDFFIANPERSQKDAALRYGYTQAWVSNVMASDAWKAAFAARRAEVVDPTLMATLNERFEGLATRSLERLMEKLDQPQVSDNLVLRAVELGAKACGVGGNAPAAPPPGTDHLARLANRLLELQAGIRKQVSNERIIDGEVIQGS